MKRPPARSLAAVASLVILAACGPDQPPMDSSPLALAPSDVHVVGTSESIAVVLDLQPLPDGSVWLFNSEEPLFLGFASDGRLVGQHGTSGGGPEEFRMPAGLVVGELDGEAWTFDFVRHAFIQVSDPDGEWAQIAIPRDVIPSGTVRGGMDMLSPIVRTARLGDEIVFPWTTGTLESGVANLKMALLGADIAALDTRTGAVREVVALRDALEDPSAGFVASDGGFPLWYRLWAVCGDHLRVYDRVRNQLRGFTGAGEEIDPVQLPPVRFTEVTPLQFARAVFPLRQAEVLGEVGSRLSAQDSARVLNTMARGLKGSPAELAAYLPRYVDFRCASDGTMWLNPIELDIGALEGSRTWLRIAPGGAVREVVLPERFDAMRFTPDRIWGVQRDEFDVASVAWIHLDR